MVVEVEEALGVLSEKLRRQEFPTLFLETNRFTQLQTLLRKLGMEPWTLNFGRMICEMDLQKFNARHQMSVF